MKKYVRSNWKPLLFSIVFSMVASIFAVGVQFLKGNVLDYALAREAKPALSHGIWLGMFIALELGFFFLYDQCRARFIVDAMEKLRFAFFSNLLARNYPAFLKKSQGEYLAQYNKEMEIIEADYFGTLPLLAEIIIKILIVSISLFILDYRLALITLFLLTTPLYLPKLLEKKLQGAQKKYLETFEGHIQTITDWLRAFEIIKNYSIEEKIKEMFKKTNGRTMRGNLEKRRLGNMTRTLSAFLSYLSHFIILVFAAYLVLRGDFTAGTFFVAVGMIDQLSYPIITLSRFIQSLVSVQPVNKSVLAFLNERFEEAGTVNIAKENFREVSFHNVSFNYGGEQVVKNLNMRFEKGKQYLLEGASGSGKTTSMNLLMNYYRPNCGTVRINGIEVGKIRNLNELMTVMRQEAVFFTDSLRNNLTMYQKISDEKIIRVLEKVGLGKLANPAGLAMMIREGGSNLSGGEKRRITLARSILRETPLLILDEPLANLDGENARTIESQLLSITDRSLLIISHRFSSKNKTKLAGLIEFPR